MVLKTAKKPLVAATVTLLVVVGSCSSDGGLEDEGFILPEEPSDEWTERNHYDTFVAFRECLIEQGIAMGESVSFETFTENPGSLGKLLRAAVLDDIVAFKEAHTKCPYSGVSVAFVGP